jgi:hypothetical protein
MRWRKRGQHEYQLVGTLLAESGGAMAEMNFEEVVALVKAAIESATFKKVNAPPGAEAYEAKQNGWHIFAITFKRPDKSKGCDGTASGVLPGDVARVNPAPALVHLTPELAQLAVERAERQLS